MPSFFARLLCLVSSPRFLAWLFRPAFKDNKVISSFSTFLRLLQSFFDIPCPFSLFSASLGALRIPSLVSATLFFEPLLFLLSLFFYSISIFSISSSHLSISSLLVLYIFCVLFFSFSSPTLLHLISCSSLSHLTFPASFRYSLHLFSFFLFRASWCSLYSFASFPLYSDGF